MELDGVDKAFAWLITLVCIALISIYVAALIHYPIQTLGVTGIFIGARVFIYPFVCDWMKRL